MDIGCKAQEAFKRGNEARGGWDNELTNFLRRRMGRQHCSSLCSQSEGDEYCGG